MSDDVATLVLAAGSGSRFGQPKQFAELKPGVRLVDAAVETASEMSDFVVLVLPTGYQWDGRPVDAVVSGGATRLASVAAGLAEVPAAMDLVLVHDAAHPLTPKTLFLDLVAALEGGADAAVPLLEVPDVIKRHDLEGNLTTVGRDGLGLAQVPMAFRAEVLRAVHSREPTPDVWEDAMLVEKAGGRVVAVPGSTLNVHVVTPEDLEIVRVLFSGGD